MAQFSAPFLTSPTRAGKLRGPAPVIAQDRLGLELIRDRHADPYRDRCVVASLAALTMNGVPTVAEPDQSRLMSCLMLRHDPHSIGR